MSLYLTKVLTLFILPLGWVLLLGIAALVSLVLGRRRISVVLVTLQLALLWIAAMPWTAYHLTSRLEGAYPPVSLDETPVADVALVLGGALGSLGQPPTENLVDSSDRVLRAARLFRAGKVPQVLAVGGNLPWLDGRRPEADLVRDLLVEWGVPRDAVIVEAASANTRENAVLAAQIVRARGWHRVLLITSAAHMLRAVGAFRKAGVEVIPSATDYGVIGPARFGLLSFLPDVGALDRTSAVLHELVGLFYYRWRGWLDLAQAAGRGGFMALSSLPADRLSAHMESFREPLGGSMRVEQG